MNYTILDACWFTTIRGMIGIVAVETWSETHEWKAYIGQADGVSEQSDAQYVAIWGSGLAAHEAHGFFPLLDITHYKKE